MESNPSAQTPQQGISIRTQQQDTSADENQPGRTKPTPKIYTYHCICTHLLFASTHSINSLPRRRAPGLDTAVIVPLPPPPRRSPAPPSSSSSSFSASEDESVPPRPHRTHHPKEKKEPTLNYTLLLSTTQDRKPHIISRADGFEKRYLWRCGRCRLIVGYQLDDVHFPSAADGDEKGGRAREKGRVLYLLPGGLMSTEEMAAGKTLSDKDIELGGEEGE